MNATILVIICLPQVQNEIKQQLQPGKLTFLLRRVECHYLPRSGSITPFEAGRSPPRLISTIAGTSRKLSTKWQLGNSSRCFSRVFITLLRKNGICIWNGWPSYYIYHDRYRNGSSHPKYYWWVFRYPRKSILILHVHFGVSTIN